MCIPTRKLKQKTWSVADSQSQTNLPSFLVSPKSLCPDMLSGTSNWHSTFLPKGLTEPKMWRILLHNCVGCYQTATLTSDSIWAICQELWQNVWWTVKNLHSNRPKDHNIQLCNVAVFSIFCCCFVFLNLTIKINPFTSDTTSQASVFSAWTYQTDTGLIISQQISLNR